MISWRLMLALLAITIACLYSFLGRRHDEFQGANYIIEGWKTIIREPARKFQRIAIGINANVDLIVPGVKLMETLGLSPKGSADHVVINSPEELQETFSIFFAKGAAVERPYGNAESYKIIVEKAALMANASWYIGGNAALMAQNIVTQFDDCEVELVGPVGPRLQQLLNPSIRVPLSSLTASDEIHLILEYAVGDAWGSALAPVATRFITSYDEANSGAASLENFFTGVDQQSPDLVVCTGLHLLESRPESEWGARLDVLTAGLGALPANLPVHMELASMVNERFVSALLTQSLARITSLGLNEQELSFVGRVLGGPHADLLTNGQPEVYKVSDTMSWILSTYGRSAVNPASRLTRVHFHSLTFHVMASVPGHWGNQEAAVAAGARAAGRKACDLLPAFGDDPSSAALNEHFDVKIPRNLQLYSGHGGVVFDGRRPVQSWDVAGCCTFSFSPVLVCRRPLRTVGLGDAISAMGLLYSEYLGS